MTLQDFQNYSYTFEVQELIMMHPFPIAMYH